MGALGAQDLPYGGPQPHRWRQRAHLYARLGAVERLRRKRRDRAGGDAAGERLAASRLFPTAGKLLEQRLVCLDGLALLLDGPLERVDLAVARAEAALALRAVLDAADRGGGGGGGAQTTVEAPAEGRPALRGSESVRAVFAQLGSAPTK